MKHLLHFLCLALFLISCNQDATLTETSEKDIEKTKALIMNVLESQEDAWNEGSIERFMAGYWNSDSLSFIGSRGIQYGYEKTLVGYQKSYPDKSSMGKLKFDIMRLDPISSEAYFMVGRYTLFREEDQPTGIFTLLWKLIDGEWLIVADQTCG